MLFDGDGTHYLRESRLRKILSCFEEMSPPITVTHTKISQIESKLGINVSVFLLVDDLSNIFNFQIILFNFNLQSTAQIYSTNLQKVMISSVSNYGIQWILDFAPDSVTIAVIDLVQNILISSQEIPLAAWQLMLSLQKQDFLDNHLPRVPITRNQGGNNEDERRSTLNCGGSRLGH